MFSSILGNNRPNTTKFASKMPKLPLKRIMKKLKIKPQNYTYLFVSCFFISHIDFFTHILQVNTLNLFHIQIHLAWVGIVQIILGNQEREKKHLKEGKNFLGSWLKKFTFQTFARKDKCKTKHKFVLDNPNLLLEF